jgi:rhodanese-related sulfurtransferase
MTTAADMVTAAKTTIDNLDVEHTAAEIADGALLVDLREHPERVDDGTIPGSLHVPRGMLEFAADPTHPLHVADLQPDRRTILYCAAGSRSALGVVTLHKLGYRDVAHLDGGIQAWTAAGRSTQAINRQ